MSRKGKIVTAAAAALIFMLAASGLVFCAGQKEKTSGPAAMQTVTFLVSSAKRPDAYKAMAEKLLEQNVKLDVQVIPDAQFSNIMLTRLATGEPPDMTQMNVPQHYLTLDVQKNCLDLSSEPWISRLVNPSIVRASDGKIYALPLEAASAFTGMYYNKGVLARLGLGEPKPKTMAELQALLDKIKAAGVVPVAMGDKDKWIPQIFTSSGLMVLLGDRGPSVMEKIRTNKLKFADVPEYLQIVTMLKNVYDRGYTNADHLTATYDDTLEAVGTGKAAMLMNGEWVIGTLESKGAQVGVFAIPYGDKDMIAIGQFVQGFLGFKNSKNPEGARKVIAAWATPEYMNLYFKDNPGFPGLKGVDGGKVNADLKAFVDYYIPQRYVFEMNDYLGAGTQVLPSIHDYYIDMIAGRMTPQQVVQAVDKVYSDYMKSTGQPGW